MIDWCALFWSLVPTVALLMVVGVHFYEERDRMTPPQNWWDHLCYRIDTGGWWGD